MNIGEDFKVEDIDLSGNLSLADKWILTRLNETIATVTDLSDKYEFGEVGRALYNFIWDDFCDWYIEIGKIPMNSNDEEQKQVTRSVLSYTFRQYYENATSIHAICNRKYGKVYHMKVTQLLKLHGQKCVNH